MEFAARTSIVLMVVFLVFIVGGVLLEIFLARRESKWPGLVLPVLTLLYSLAMACNVAAIGDSFPWGGVVGDAGGGEHPHGSAAGDLCCLPGKAAQAQRAGQDGD